MIASIGIVLLIIVSVIVAFSWYRIVPSSQAHLVIYGKGGSKVFSSNKKFQSGGANSSYFNIPNNIPYFGREVRVMDVTIKEIKFPQETYEKKQARYKVTSSTKFRVVDVIKASESFRNEDDMAEQLKEIIQSSVRAVTVDYDVNEARAKKEVMSDKIESLLSKDINEWGVELVNFVLVDFMDTSESSIISDISKRREIEISSTTRELNAEKKKQASMKEAEADQLTKAREIERDKVVAEKKQLMAQAVSKEEKIAKEKEYAVKQVEVIKQAEIDKEKAIVKANETKETAIIKAKQDKESEAILKEKKILEGQGDRARDEQQAIGISAETKEMGIAQGIAIKEKGLAEANVIKEKLLGEAEGKGKLQKVLSNFDDVSIRALTEELRIKANRDVGLEGAKALTEADIKMFTGSDGGNGFDLGKMISATNISNSGTAEAILNKLARPNDLGLAGINLGNQPKPKPKPKPRPSKRNDYGSF